MKEFDDILNKPVEEYWHFEKDELPKLDKEELVAFIHHLWAHQKAVVKVANSIIELYQEELNRK